MEIISPSTRFIAAYIVSDSNGGIVAIAIAAIILGLALVEILSL